MPEIEGEKLMVACARAGVVVESISYDWCGKDSLHIENSEHSR